MAVTSGVLAIVCVIRWLWETDRPVAVKEAEVGPGIVLPTYVTGPRTHGWWAMTVLLIVVGMVWAMTVFGWFFVYGAHPGFWKPAPASAWAWGIAAGYAAVAVLAIVSRRLLAREQSTLWSPPTLLLSSALLLGVVFAVDLWSWRSAGLDPQLTAQWALVAAFLSQAGFLVADRRDDGAVHGSPHQPRPGDPSAEQQLRPDRDLPGATPACRRACRRSSCASSRADPEWPLGAGARRPAWSGPSTSSAAT